MVHYFGIRHLSPNGAAHLRSYLDKIDPEIVLIEGPSDFTPMMEYMINKKTKPPFAVMAYSESLPIQTILCPFAVYSPEYQAVLWSSEHKKPCKFIDLPSSVFLSINKNKREREQQEALEAVKKKSEESEQAEEKSEQTSKCEEKEQNQEEEFQSVYEKLESLTGEDHETYWERNFEHTSSYQAYIGSAYEFGRGLRDLNSDTQEECAETLIRESYMKYEIEKAVKEGYQEDKIVVVTGAYHVDGLKNGIALTEKEVKTLPSLSSKSTMMPYSYYRLSARTGYGAGNRAPQYYELLWDGIQRGDIERVGFDYLSRIAAYQRKTGNMVSSAEVIEAVRLSKVLAGLKGGNLPTLMDLQDAAMTCMGHGHFLEISHAAADTEIGTKIGSLPEGVSQTSIQEDFYFQLKDLKLEKYKTMVAEGLELDLRENNRVKTEKAAFLDLERSFFLHRLRVLGIHFAEQMKKNQDKATWAEAWSLRWTPEAEIEIVEACLKGDTVELAAAFLMAEQLQAAVSLSEASKIISEACLCGMPQTLENAVTVLQNLAVEAASILEIGETIDSLSFVVRFGSIRRLKTDYFISLLQQLFYRACLILPDCCICDNKAVERVLKAVSLLNDASVNHDFLPEEHWISVLEELSDRDDINTLLSGYSTAVLMERGKMSQELLVKEVSRRLSKGIPADLGAAWFEGLSMRNRYALITRLSLWEQLSLYIETLDDEEFKRALVFLRRAFCSFSSQEKYEIAENLGEIWGMNAEEVSEILNNQLEDEQQELLESLDEFDFGDI